MERNEVSIHEVRLFLAMKSKLGEWVTNKQLALDAGIAERTARAHTLKLVNLGILDQAEVFPAHRFRLAEKAEQRNTAYFKRLNGAVKVFGL